MSVSKEVIYKKIQQILEEFDYSKNYLYEEIYSNLKGLEKEICISFHSRLNDLFDFMNQKSKTNRNFNAEPSRELIKLIQDIKEVEKLYSKIGKVFKIDNYYKQPINYTSKFLVPRYGSEIPEDYQEIEITDIEPVFFIQDDNSTIKIYNQGKITREFALEQFDKIEKKLDSGDFDGVITNVRSLLEDVLIEIYKEATNIELDRNGKIEQYWNKLKKELNLDPKNQLNDSLKQIITGLSSILNGLASLRNIAGDGHSRKFKPSKRHAKLAVNSAFAFIDFIYDVLEYQKFRIEELQSELDNFDKNLPYKNRSEPFREKYERKTRDELLKESEVKSFLEKCDNFLKRKLLEYVIENGKIRSFSDSAVFL